LISRDLKVSSSRILILGITFKENCPDIRNSKVIDIVSELIQFKTNVDVYDPHADKVEVEKEYGIKLIDKIDSKYDAIILAVSHKEFKKLFFNDLKISTDSIIFDIKGFLDRGIVDIRL
jgi:UDP-N-acetyl-D-galactosamine dehydrogenase